MEKQIRTVFSPCESEKIIEKSKFLTYSTHVESEDEARAFITRLLNTKLAENPTQFYGIKLA